MPMPRVFVSSIVKDFGPFRAAASRGIERAGAEPVLVNETFAADSRSSRNACLDAVASCDALVLIIAPRGGWTTPSGKLVIEEEYEEALRRRLPVYVFVQSGSADADAKRLIVRVSDYVDGRFRREFSTQEELEEDVFTTINGLLTVTDMSRISPSVVDMRVSERRAHIQNEPVLRVALAPERQEELIGPVELSSGTFVQTLYRLGHEGESPLFDYSRPKTSRHERDSIVIEQTDPDSRHSETRRVWLSVDEQGVMVIEANVGNRRRDARDGFSSGLAVYVADIEAVFRTIFAFAAAFYAARDPYKRHHRLLYNVALVGLDYRKILRSEPRGNGFPMSMRGSNEPLVAFDEARTISRDQLEHPHEEIERAIVLFERADRG
jgi:uncharacterized protein DUF4062